jgi:hypothetical protein
MLAIGEVERARQLIEATNRRGAELGRAPSLAHPLVWEAALEVFPTTSDPAARRACSARQTQQSASSLEAGVEQAGHDLAAQTQYFGSRKRDTPVRLNI